MSDFDKKQGQEFQGGQSFNQGSGFQGGQGQGGQGQGGQGQGGQGQGGQGQGGQGQGGQGQEFFNQGQQGFAQNGPGAFVWLRWSDNAPESARKEFANAGFNNWYCKSGDWNCKFWIPAQSEAEAKKFFDAKFGKNEFVKDTKFEWNWNQGVAA
ncbi:MAG: hypothetical protein ACRYGR_09785 [Janthinobacterium lividum]